MFSKFPPKFIHCALERKAIERRNKIQKELEKVYNEVRRRLYWN